MYGRIYRGGYRNYIIRFLSITYMALCVALFDNVFGLADSKAEYKAFKQHKAIDNGCLVRCGNMAALYKVNSVCLQLY